jgi:hypothetical protein
MPIEIRELVIKATVTHDEGSGGGTGSSDASGNTSSSEELIKTCVEKVLEILKDKNER